MPSENENKIKYLKKKQRKPGEFRYLMNIEKRETDFSCTSKKKGKRVTSCNVGNSDER